MNATSDCFLEEIVKKAAVFERLTFFTLSFFLLMVLAGCGIGVLVFEDNYSLDKIDGDITCEYRIGKDAKWMEECIESEVIFDKDMFLRLFQEHAQYEPFTGSKDPLKCDCLKIDSDEQPEEWEKILNSEFNVKAVFGDDQRNVSIYRYGGKLYFFVLSMGERSKPEEKGEYYMELSKEMSDYWKTIIDAVEAGLPR